MGLDYKTIGSRIKKARLKKNMTQENLSEQLGVSTPYLSDLENGKTRLNLPKIEKLCEILDVNGGYFLDGSDTSKSNFLDNDFLELLSKCTPKQKKKIYKIIKIMVED